jgi:hypothetical protein
MALRVSSIIVEWSLIGKPLGIRVEHRVRIRQVPSSGAFSRKVLSGPEIRAEATLLATVYRPTLWYTIDLLGGQPSVHRKPFRLCVETCSVSVG